MLNYVIHNNEKENWVVFIHGIGGNTKMWKRQLKSFSEKYNLLLLDLPGHGLSQEEELIKKITPENVNLAIKEVLDKENIQKADFVVLSLGCLVIANFVIDYPQYVNSIVFGGSMLKISTFYKVLATIIKKTKRIVPYRFIYKLLALMIIPSKSRKRLRNFFVRESLKMGRESFLQWVDYIAQISHPNKLFKRMKELSIKMLFVSGEEDIYFLEGTKELSKTLKESSIKVIEKCGHICSIEKPQEFNEISLDFLNNVHTPILT